MKWPFRKSEQRSADYGAALAQAFQTIAGGTLLDAAQTSAAEFSVGLMGRAFATADVDGVDLHPSTLEAIGRGLGLRGNFVADVRADPVGGLTLLQAAGWDIAGGPDPVSWNYALQLPGPSADQNIIRAGTDVIHVKINALPESPWSGRSPLVAAGFTGKLLANLESKAGEEAGSKVGRLLSTPPLNAESKAQLLRDLGSLRGGISVVENGGGNFARPTQGGGNVDWRTNRFGADFPDGNVMMRRQVGADVVASFGVPSALYIGGDGAAVREGWREFGVNVESWGAIVSAELSAKLERPISLSFKRLASADMSAKSRAFGTFVMHGMSIDDALIQAGLEYD